MTHLKEGDKAPDFKGINQKGEEVSLADFKGKKIVLYFYPKDDTPGCTKEACNFRDNYKELQDKGFAVVGVSADTARKHQNFVDKYDLPFTLIADTDKRVIEAYGVWGKKKFMGREFMGINRSTFLINEKGKIFKVFLKVKPKGHSKEVLDCF